MQQTNARAKKSIKNAVVSTAYYLIILGLSFISRKAFFDYLGSEVLGLNATAKDLLSFLNLTELGIGSAVGFFLYKPVFEEDHTKINEIITVQGWLYRKIAYIIIAASCVLMCFFPMIFAKSELPLSYAYIVFGTLLVGSILSYFYNYRQILLSADQKNYKIIRNNSRIEIIKIILQIIFVTKFSHPFFWWVVLEFLARVFATIGLDRVIRREYPWLNLSLRDGKRFYNENKGIIQKTKQIFFHKIAGTVLSNSSAPILYAFTTLTTVAYYNNYQIILQRIATLMRNFFTSTSAAIGSLVAEGNKKSIHRVFWELFDSRLVIVAVILICSFHLTEPFISVWLSPDYLLGRRFLILFLILQGILMSRETVDSFINAHGMFQDIWAPIVEASLNIGLSIFFGHLWGLEGVILGVTTSLVLIIEIWKPIFLFKYGMKESPIPYFLGFGFRLAVILAIAYVSSWIVPYLPFHEEASTSIAKWLLYSTETTILVSLMIIPAFWAFSDGTKNFVRRMTSIITSEFHKRSGR